MLNPHFQKTEPTTVNFEQIIMDGFSYLWDSIHLTQEKIDTAIHNIEIYNVLEGEDIHLALGVLDEQKKLCQYQRELDYYILNILLYGDSETMLSYLR